MHYHVKTALFLAYFIKWSCFDYKIIIAKLQIQCLPLKCSSAEVYKESSTVQYKYRKMDSLNAVIILEHIQLVENTAACTHQYRNSLWWHVFHLNIKGSTVIMENVTITKNICVFQRLKYHSNKYKQL